MAKKFETLRLHQQPCTKLGLFFGIFTTIFCFIAPASPFPGTAASALVSPEYGLFYSSKGFTIKALPSWKLAAEETEKEGLAPNPEFSVQYLHPEFKSARLSLQTDTLSSNLSLEAYTKKWMKDYSSYGFDVLGAKNFQTVNARGLVIDLHHQKKDTQLRQVIFLKERTAVILTCLDQPKSFSKSLTGCNQLIKSFSWTDSRAKSF